MNNRETRQNSDNATCEFSIANQVALITGGSRGLGLSMAHALGAAGGRLVITARKQDELDKARAELEGCGYPVVAIRNDLSELATVPELAETVMDTYGQIDILVNNAGATWGAPAVEYPEQAWNKVFNVNVHGTWALTREVAERSMIPRNRGAIIFIASITGLGANAPGEIPTVAYNSSKAAQLNLTRSLAAEWGQYGIRVNAILPGLFPSKMTTVMIEKQGADFSRRTPLRRLGETRDLAGPLLFLASDASRYVTGACLNVDGGYSVVV